LGIEVVNLAGEAVRRKPFGHRIGVEEGAIDSFSRGTEDAVKPDGIWGHDGLSFQFIRPEPGAFEEGHRMPNGRVLEGVLPSFDFESTKDLNPG
jgi:hypothetical protein